MKTLYIVIMLSLTVVMGLFYGVVNVKKPMTKEKKFLFLSVGITVLLNLVSISTSSEGTALVLRGCYYAATDWMLFSLLVYMEQYAGGFSASRQFKGIVCFLAAADTISMLLNIGFHHVFTCEYIQLQSGEMCFAFQSAGIAFILHNVFVYILSFFGCLILFFRVLKSNVFYRKKYTTVLVIMAIILTLNAVGSLAVPMYLDFPLALYMILAMAVTYFSVFYIPKDLVAEMMSYCMQDMNTAIACFDYADKCIYANEEARKLLGVTDEMDSVKYMLIEELGGDQFRDIPERKWHKVFMIDSKPFHYEIQFEKLYAEKGTYIGCYFTLYDRTEDVEKITSERYRATHDPLTDLYTREYFYERVREMLKCIPEDLCMICTNIKDFKLLNSIFGTSVGNEILVKIGEVLRREVNYGAVYCRLESDRFAVCMPKKNFDEQRFLGYVQETAQILRNSEFRFDMRIGVYEISDRSITVAAMCDRAMMAINSLKNNYASSICYYSNEMLEKALHEKMLVGEFEHALKSGQFCIYVQPQVAADGTVSGAEALVRWIHPDRGMISPGEFIPVFEKTGLIHKLDCYVWELACKKLRQWKEEGRENLYLSVNISQTDFYYLDIYRCFTELVEAYDINPHNLKLEITESALMMDLEKQLVLIERLQNYGFQIEIDDFGSGYSSLNMLKDIKADILKLDMLFLSKTPNVERNRIIIATIIALAKKLQMPVITEGVETHEQVAFLTEMGSDMFQGYYFAKPMPLKAFEEYIAG